MPAKKDIYDQFMYLAVTMSAANTITFGQVSLGMSIFDYAALVLSRIEYDFAYTKFGELIANSDHAEMAITGSDQLSNLVLDQAEVYDMAAYSVGEAGTPGNATIYQQPLIHDFTGMKGGGLIVPAQNVFLGMNTAGFSAAASCVARVYYTVKALAAADFIELVQRLRVLST